MTQKPLNSFDFDLFVIGGGSGGVRAARMASNLGARVALAEGGALGGTCVNLGCIPKKLYSYASGYAEAFEEMAGFGWNLSAEPTFDWNCLKANRAKEIGRLNRVYANLLDKNVVLVVRGWAQLEDAHTVVVDGQRYRSRYILVATGGTPQRMDIPGGEHALVSDAMFDLERVPQRLVIAGGGYIGCEFASIFQGLGSKVTMLIRRDRILPGFDLEIQKFLATELSKRGIEIRTGSPVREIKVRDHLGSRRHVVLESGEELVADTVLHAIGRRPRTDGLGLEKVGLALDERRAIVVDEQYRSSVPSIFAVGDVASRFHLTPVALAEAMVVVDMLFGQGRRRMSYDFIPTAVFTHPEVATCGLTEAEAQSRYGVDSVRIFCSEFTPLRHTLSGRGERTFMKLVVDKQSDRVVGLHMVGAEAGEIVQGFAVAMNAGATKAVFDATLGIHPTGAEEFVTMREPVRG